MRKILEVMHGVVLIWTLIAIWYYKPLHRALDDLERCILIQDRLLEEVTALESFKYTGEWPNQFNEVEP